MNKSKKNLMLKKSFHLFLLTILVFSISLSIYPQLGVPKVKVKEVVEISLLPLAEKFAIEDEIVVFVKFTIQEGYHIYHPTEEEGIPTQIKIETDKQLVNLAILYPQPVIKNFPKLGRSLKLYEGEVYVATVFKAQQKGSYTLHYWIKFAPCTQTTCLSPGEKVMDIGIIVTESGTVKNKELERVYSLLKTGAQNKQSSFSQTSTSDEELSFLSKIDFLRHNRVFKILWFLILGFLSAFTPCVLPVLPITIGWFSTLSKGKVATYIGLVLLYIVSSSVVFGALGILSSTIGKYVGFHLGNFYVVLLTCSFFILLAYWVMGAVEIPSLGIQTKFSGNVFSAIIFGSLSGIILSPCIGPILLLVLKSVGHYPPFISFSLLGLYGMGLNIPLIIGSFSLSTIRKVSKSQKIYTAIHLIFSLLILGSILYFGWGYYRKLYGYLAIITIALGVLIDKYMYIKFKNIPEVIDVVKNKIIKSAFVIFLVLTSAFFVRIMYDNESAQKLFNRISVEEGIKKSLQENKPLLVRYTAKWCMVCLEQKYTLLNDEEVIRALKDFFLVEIDCTDDSNHYCADKFIQLGLTNVGFPLITFYSKNGKLYEDYILQGHVDKSKFLSILKIIKEKE